MSYKVVLPVFEGPFDLLVYLIEDAQVDIYDIPIAKITDQYILSLRAMKEIDINLASEFTVLAAELIEIKSRMMLPTIKSSENTEVIEDPRTVLVKKLVAYRRCKIASGMLEECMMKTAGIFEKPQEDISVYLNEPDEILKLDLNEFAKAFTLFLQRKKRIEETHRRYETLQRERETVERRIDAITEIFNREINAGRSAVNFNEFVPDKTKRYDVVISFVSLLQLMSEKYLNASQKKPYGDIRVTRGERELTERWRIDEQKDN